MESQTHLRVGKKGEKREREREKDGKNIKPTYIAASIPPWRVRHKHALKCAAPGALDIGVYTGNHRRHPLPSPIFRLRFALPITGVLVVGGVKNWFCTQGLNPQLDNGEVTFRSQSASGWTISMSHQKWKWVQIQYLNPGVGWKGWHTACQPPKISELWTFHAQCRKILHLHCFTSRIAGRAGVGLNSMWQCMFHTPPLRWRMVQTYNTMSFIVATSTTQSHHYELHEKMITYIGHMFCLLGTLQNLKNSVWTCYPRVALVTPQLLYKGLKIRQNTVS